MYYKYYQMLSVISNSVLLFLTRQYLFMTITFKTVSTEFDNLCLCRVINITPLLLCWFLLLRLFGFVKNIIFNELI